MDSLWSELYSTCNHSTVSIQVPTRPLRGAAELNRTLEIRNIQPSDAAVYQCETRLTQNHAPVVKETVLEVSSKTPIWKRVYE